MIKICVIAPVHHNKDIRIFQKEILTLLDQSYKVTQISRITSLSNNRENFKQLEVPGYKTRLKRFSLQIWLLSVALREKADIYHIHNPDTLPIGFLLKLLGKKVIYDTHEDFSKRIFLREWIPNLLKKPLSSIITNMERIGSYIFDHTFVTQKHMLKKFSEKTSLLYNYPVLNSETIDNANTLSKLIKNKEFTFIYAGGISEARGIETVIDCIEIINQHHASKLVLLGKFSDNQFKLKLMSKSGWKYVNYKGEVNQESVFAEMMRANLGLIILKDIGDHSTTSPNKLFEYQQFGLPFIASDFPTWKKLFENQNSGFFINPTNKKELIRLMNYCIQNESELKEMGYRGSELVKKNYNWESESLKMLSVYQGIIKNLP